MEPIYMTELMNTVLLEITVKHVFIIAIGALIGIVMVYLLHKLKGKK